MTRFQRVTLTLLTVLVALSPAAYAATSEEQLHLADKFAWLGDGGVRAVRISGKFNSRELMVEHLGLDHHVGQLPDIRSPQTLRTWTLGDILVSMELNANGYVASWTVAGPAKLVTAYVDSLSKANGDRSVLYDFSSRDLEPRFSRD